MLIFLVGSGSLALYQVMSMEDELDAMTQAVDRLDGDVKKAPYARAKFFGIAKALLILAPKDPNAEKIVVYDKLRQLQATQPELSALNAPLDTSTNAAPVVTPK